MNPERVAGYPAHSPLFSPFEGHLGGGDPVAPGFQPLSGPVPGFVTASCVRERMLPVRMHVPAPAQSAAGHHPQHIAGASDGQGPHALDLSPVSAPCGGSGSSDGEVAAERLSVSRGEKGRGRAPRPPLSAMPFVASPSAADCSSDGRCGLRTGRAGIATRGLTRNRRHSASRASGGKPDLPALDPSRKGVSASLTGRGFAPGAFWGVRA